MVSTFWIDSSESSQQALGCRDYPWWSGTWPWVIGGQGEIGVQSESLLGVDVQSLSPVCLFSTLWAAARQASLSFTISWRLLKLVSIESVMLSNHLILCYPLLLLPSIFPSIMVFSSESSRCLRAWQRRSFSMGSGWLSHIWQVLSMASLYFLQVLANSVRGGPSRFSEPERYESIRI